MQDVDVVLTFNGSSFLAQTNPAPITVAAGSNGSQTFTVTVLAGVSNAPVTIDAEGNGTEQYSNRLIQLSSGSNDVDINVQAQQALQIVDIVDVDGRGTYIEGESFQVRVDYQNTGGTDGLGVDATLDFNGYGYLTANNPASITVSAGSNNSQLFTITVLSGAINSNVTIDALVTGTERYSQRAVSVSSGTNDLNVMVQASANLTITSIQDVNGRGIYVEGETFVVRVNYQNVGGTDAININASLVYNGYMYLSSNNSAPVNVTAGGIASQDFLVTVLSGATNAFVTIDALASGTEQYSGRPLSAVSGIKDLDINIQAQANLTITSIQDITGRGLYIEGETFIVRVNLQNSGGTDVLSVDSDLIFSGSSFLSASNPAPKTISADQSGYQDFTVTVLSGAANANVTITANASGTEQYSGRSLSVTSGANYLNITIQSQANLQIINITDITGRGTYVEGESFNIRVYYNNTGGTAAISVDSVLDFSSYMYLSASDPSPITVNADETTYQDFTIFVLSEATNENVTIDATTTGTEEHSGRSLITSTTNFNNLQVSIQARARLEIISIQDMSGHGIYVEDETFTIRVNYQNVGGTDALNVDANLDFNGYTYLTATDPAPITVAAGSIGYQEFNITVLSNPMNAMVTIDATAIGSEEYSLRILNAQSGDNDLDVGIQSHQDTSIDAVVDVTFLASYVQGMTFNVNVTLSNTGGTAVMTGVLALTFNQTGLTASQQTGITLAAGTSTTREFTVSIEANATTGWIGIGATFSAVEQYTMQAVIVSALNGTEAVHVQSSEALNITSITDVTGLPAYVQGMTFTVNVTLVNTAGGTDVVDGVLNIVTPYSGFNSSPVTGLSIPAGSSITLSVVVLISETADTGLITFDANFTGKEDISNDSVLLPAPNVPFTITVKSSASLVISDVRDMTDTAPYSLGEVFEVRITVQNNGGTSVVNATVWLTFGTASGYQTVPTNITNQVISPGQKDFFFNVSITSNASIGIVKITAHVSGFENISSDAISDTDSRLQVYVEPPTEFRIEKITNANTPPAPYARGSTFVVTVQLSIWGGQGVENGTLALKFSLSPGYSANTTYTNVSLANGTRNYDFEVSVSPTAQTGTLTINANFSGFYSNGTALYVDTAITPLSVDVLAPSNLTITAITDDTGLGTYVQDMKFNIRVWFNNTGELNMTVDSLVLDFNGASGYSQSSVSPFVVPGGEGVGVSLIITISASASTGPVTIDASINGTEDITNQPVSKSSGANDLTVSVQSSANLVINGIEDFSGNNTYVEGESFIIRVHYQNLGGTDALSVDSNLDFGGYAYLSSSNPSPVNVTANGTSYQEFVITVLSGAEDQVVIIDAAAVGIEDISGNSLSALSGSNDLSIVIQSKAQVSVKSISIINASSQYVQGMNLTVRVRLENLGGTAALGVNVTLVFNRSGYSGSSSVIDIPAGTTDITVDLSVWISDTADAGTVSIDALATGVENHTGRVISDLDGATTPTSINVLAHASLLITQVVDITGQPYYTQGQNIQVNVTLNNTMGGADVTQGTLELLFSPSAGYSSPAQGGITVPAGSVVVRQFIVTISTSAQNGSIMIDANFTGKEAFSGKSVVVTNASSPLNITVKERSTPLVALIEDLSGQPVHNLGESFLLNVIVVNFGEANAVSGTLQLTFGVAENIVANPVNVTGIVINGYSTATYQFNITILENATVGTINITCTFSALEEYSSRSLLDINSTIITVQERSQLIIDSVTLFYVNSLLQGGWFRVEVSVRNTGTVSVINGNLTLFFNMTGFTVVDVFNNLTIEGGGPTADPDVYRFRINIDYSSDYGFLLVDAEFHGLEDGTLNAVDVVGAASPLTLEILPRQAEMQLVAGTMTFNNTEGPTVYQGQDNLLLSFKVTNVGGSAVVFLDDYLDFSLNDGDFIYSDYTLNPNVINPGETVQLSFIISISNTAMANASIDVFADLSGNDDYYGSGVFLYTKLLTWVVKEPPAVQITNISVGMTEIPLGLPNITMRVDLYNPSIYNASLTNFTLQFLNGTTDYVDGFILLINTTFPVIVPSKASLTIYYDSSVKSSATANVWMTIGGIVDAYYNHSGYMFNASTSAVNDTDRIVIREPEPLTVAITSITANTLYLGQPNIQLEVNITNIGLFDANLTGLEILFTNGSVDYSTNFTLSTAATFPQVLASGTSLSLIYNISVKIDATKNILLTVHAIAIASDLSGYGFDLTSAGTTRNETVIINEPEHLQITTIEISDTTFTQGQTGIELWVVLNNPSIFNVSVTSLPLSVMTGPWNFTSNYTISSVQSFPIVLGSGSSINMTFIISIDPDATIDLHLYAVGIAHGNYSTLDMSSALVASLTSFVVKTPAQVNISDVVIDQVNVTLGQQNIMVNVTIENVNGTAAAIDNITLSFAGGSQDANYNVSAVGNVTGIVLNPGEIITVSFMVNVSLGASVGFTSINAVVHATGHNIGNDASDLDGADVPVNIYVQSPAQIQISNVITDSIIHFGNETSVNIVVQNTGGTDALIQRVTLRFFINNVDVSIYAQTLYITIFSSASHDINEVMSPGEISTMQFQFKLFEAVVHDYNLTAGDTLELIIEIEAIDVNTGFAIGIDNYGSPKVIDLDLQPPGGDDGGEEEEEENPPPTGFEAVTAYVTENWYWLLPIFGIVILSIAIGARRARVQKAKKIKAATKGKEYFAKQMAGITGKYPPFVGKGKPAGKGIGEAAEEEEEKRELTPEELEELKKTEAEVTTFKEKKICIVHKGPVAGSVYLCPQCDAIYCMKCARALKSAGEKCWQCGAEIVVADLPAGEGVQPAAPAAGVVAPPKRAGPSFVSRNMPRITKAMDALGLSHEVKIKYLKEMAAMPDDEQERFLIELEKMANPNYINNFDVAPLPENIDRKLDLLATWNQEPASITDPELAEYLSKEFRMLDPAIIKAINILDWPKEQKIALARELLGLMPDDQSIVLAEILRAVEEDENETDES
ncbi:MAG: hypothetical protein ACXQS8_03110 [Candidatus Helarchaeales archaeon]